MLLLCCLYRSPNSTETNNSKVNEILANIESHPSTQKLVVGDLNCKEIDWTNNATTVGYNHPASIFLETVMDNVWYQHVSQLTPFRDDPNPSILDLILANEENIINNLQHTRGK